MSSNCPECNMSSMSKGFPHYAFCSKASLGQKGLTDLRPILDIIEGMKRKVKPLSKKRISRLCELIAYNNNTIYNKALTDLLDKLTEEIKK